MSGDAAGWPAHTYELRPWRQSQRAGTRDNRVLNEITVALPPLIAAQSIDLSAALATDAEEALREVAVLEAAHAAHLAALNDVLIRTESVASSKIEHVEASTADYARALYGMKVNPTAVSMASATAAIAQLVASVDDWRADIALEPVLAAHSELMREDPLEARYAGRIRDVQNWIGGSNESPRYAVYIPPPADLVPMYLDDLFAFANRDDLPVLVQAAIVHAQFESIHPFTDGNGRIGRALINTVLRRRGATGAIVIPVAAAIVADVRTYFDLLDRYRDGETAALISTFAQATAVAARESQLTAQRIADLPARWREAVGPVRTGSTLYRLLDALSRTTALSADDVERFGSGSSAYRAIERLVDAGILRPLTDSKRNQLWGVAALLDELDDLTRRIERAAPTVGRTRRAHNDVSSP